MKQSCDILVVGAGSAGAPLAARLSEDPSRTVMLLEAGPRFIGAASYPPELRYAGVLRAMLPGHPNNWDLTATLGEAMLQPLPRGRVVGGSSALNGALFTRGLPQDFDGWAGEGNPDWSYERVLPFFRKLENDRDIRDDFHGSNGPVPIRRAGEDELVPIDRAFTAACREAGFPDDPDMNGPESIGIGLLPTNTSGGVRMNTALAYLDPAEHRPNLTVTANAQVRRILMEGNHAVGVEAVIDGQPCTVFAGEVILSAGAVKSPQLLMVSGIGPADELRRHAIPVRHELPMVGRRFTDHGSLTMPFRMPKRRSPMPDPKRSTWAHCGLHFTSSASDEVSDLLLMQSAIPTTYSIFHGQSLIERARTLRQTLGGISPSRLLDYARFGWDHAITCVMLRDESEGEIRLTSPDPAAKPELRYRYLATERDRARMREALRTAAQLVASGPYRDLGAQRAILSDAELDDDDLLDRHVSQHLGTSIHMASSCRMGPSPETAVVDQHCRVHGLKGLRVVDTSIMPRVVRRCPAASALMLGERAAQFFD
ncbi:MAG: GMC family oxidoreductase N-terminal domain-containing protein [Novosphingobium sp.]|nr:GMC family oxidoreductase N-terminal domain-containing protein [Novosphingobium sp.]MCP5403990.1 GMC family oxidoreductase N-terminal domain-containing protein [Novosphingobium sp.]